MNYIILNKTEDFRNKIKINGFKEVENAKDRVDAVFIDMPKVVLDDIYSNGRRREGVLPEQWLLRDRGVQFILCRFNKFILHDESQKSIERLIGLYDKESHYIEIRSYYNKKSYNQIECYLFAYNKNFGFRENIFPDEIDNNIFQTLCECIEKEFYG